MSEHYTYGNKLSPHNYIAYIDDVPLKLIHRVPNSILMEIILFKLNPIYFILIFRDLANNDIGHIEPGTFSTTTQLTSL